MTWSTVVKTMSFSQVSFAVDSSYNYRVRNTGVYSAGYGLNQGSVQFDLSPGMAAAINFTSGQYFIYSNSDALLVEREAKNSAPTIPGPFTQPTGTLETGDSKTISWGGSSDAESDLSKYILEASVNGGTFAVIAQTTTPTFLYTVPTATSVKFRVKAADSDGLESAYRDSAQFTVTKPMYYWSKYNVSQKTSYNDTAPWEGAYSASLDFGSTFKTYTFYRDANIYVCTDPWTGYFAAGSVGYVYFSGILYRYTTMHSGLIGQGNTALDYVQKHTSKNTSQIDYTRGSIIQSGLTAVEGTYPVDGRHTDGYWYVRGLRVNQSIVPPSAFTSPAPQTLLQPKQVITLAFGASKAPAISTYEVESRYNNGAWNNVGTHANALTRAFTVTEDKSLMTVEFRVRAKNTSNVYSDYVYSEAFTIEHNKVPTVTLNTENNKTLYENDTFKIDGSTIEPDIGDIVNVYYRLNGGTLRAIATGISTGAAIQFNEQLTFKAGKLHKDGVAITDALAEGPAHQLEVWSQDNQGGKSEIASRTFYVVPNRPPALTVAPFTEESGMINNDKITLSGTSSDPDGNDVKVAYKLNSNAAVQIHNGVAGPWTFDLSLKLLKDGENIIVVEVTDTYDFKTSKTIKLNKTANLTPLEHSVQRYKIVPPSGSAQGVLLWIQRAIDQEVTAEISMTTGSEQEQFVPLTLENTAPVGESVEDYFKFRADTPAEHIVLKLSWTGDKPITLISGALLQ